jgi:hypothetical protein
VQAAPAHSRMTGLSLCQTMPLPPLAAITRGGERPGRGLWGHTLDAFFASFFASFSALSSALLFPCMKTGTSSSLTGMAAGRLEAAGPAGGAGAVRGSGQAGFCGVAAWSGIPGPPGPRRWPVRPPCSQGVVAMRSITRQHPGAARSGSKEMRTSKEPAQPAGGHAQRLPAYWHTQQAYQGRQSDCHQRNGGEKLLGALTLWMTDLKRWDDSQAADLIRAAVS